MSKNRGFASIVVSLILVLVFSLITLGFATISRREQQNALNKQLATQAEYAAESWINSKLKSGSLAAINTCEEASYDAANNVKVTCGLITPNLTRTPVTLTGSTAVSKIVDYTTPTTPPQSAPTKFTIKWNSSNAAKKNPLTSMFNPFNDSTYQSPSIMQISITPINELSRDCLINKTFNAFLYPGGATATPNIALMPALKCPAVGVVPAPQPANKYFGRCNGSGSCAIDIWIDAANRSSGKFLFRFLAPYGAQSDSTEITISGQSVDSGGAISATKDTGTVILDVTAKAQDVVKRVQVAVPVTVVTSGVGGSNAPSYLIQADSACKRLIDQEVTTTPPGSKSYPSIFSAPSAYTGSSCNLLNADL